MKNKRANQAEPTGLALVLESLSGSAAAVSAFGFEFAELHHTRFAAGLAEGRMGDS